MDNLVGNRIYLRKLCDNDATQDYVQWMNDYRVTRYTESRFYPQDMQSIRGFIEHANNANNITFAIIDKESEQHIGNIKLGGINWYHRYCDIGLIIGRQDCWGRGYGTEAIECATNYALHVLNLRMVWAGIYAPNVGSKRAFEKAGYTQAYIMPHRYFFENEYVDCYVLEKYNTALN